MILPSKPRKLLDQVLAAGDTRFVLNISIVMASLLAGLSWLTIEVWKVGIYACWIVVTGWICAMGVVFWLRFLQGSWRSMRVIEQHHHGAAIEPSPNGEPHED